MELEADDGAKHLGGRFVARHGRPREQHVAQVLERYPGRQDRANGEAGALEQPADEQSALGQEEPGAAHPPITRLTI